MIGKDILKRSLQEALKEKAKIKAQIDDLNLESQEIDDVIKKIQLLITDVSPGHSQEPLSIEEDFSIVRTKNPFQELSIKNLILYILTKNEVGSKQIFEKMESVGRANTNDSGKDPMATIRPTISRLKRDGLIENTEDHKLKLTDSGANLIEQELNKLREIENAD